MYFNVAQLLQEPMGAVRRIELTGEGPESVHGTVKMVRTDKGIMAKVDVTATVEATCSRCLCHCDCPLRLTFDEEFFPLLEVFTGLPLETSEEPEAFTIDGDHILDLSEAVRQYSLMALPIKPLCREDCPGLCPQCGTNLNEGACNCKAPVGDQRWAKLEAALGGLSGWDGEKK